jgi:oxygen-independent coproporphyrinogen-3 oxidase
VQEQYVEALCREIQETSPEYREFQVVSVFIGGGTPSVLQPEQTVRIMETVKHCFALTDTCEISMEMNPGTVTPEKMRSYHACGINRISIGLQSANDRELKALGRIHTYADFLKAYEMAVEAGFTNINVDLMSAIPEQTMDSYQETLQKALALQPPPAHISAYSLIVEEGTPFYEQELNLPDEDTERRMYEITDDILRKAGYHRYEISNYAKEGKECFHNKVYWQRGNYLGLGIGSASLIRNVRFHNMTDILNYVNLMLGKNEIEDASKEHGGKFHAGKDYLKKENAEKEQVNKLREDVQELPVEEEMEEFMFLGLRMMEGVSERKFYENFGRRFEEVFPGVIEKHEKLGLLEVTGEEFVHLRLTPHGIDVSNQVFVDFML